jgi:parallel beta-helix repeat protein
VVTLQDIAKQQQNQGYLIEESPHIWYTKVSLYLTAGVTLVLDKKDVTWLKLESNQKQFAIIRARDADIRINGVKITSWENAKKTYDTTITDGRSFIMAKDNARLDIANSELAFLGYATSPDLTVSPYGVSWKMSTAILKKEMLTGEVTNSKFHDNYFGAYTYGATGITWKGNEFYHNIRYGLDPHDDSNGFLVENNKAYDNGSHGIIFSKRCMDNIIVGNISYNNKLHGIMLHEKSDNNIIENNVLDGNTSGIALWHASHNIVKNNTIANNRHGIRVNMEANDNTITQNAITNSSLYGLYLYDNANNNILTGNTVKQNTVGIYIKSNENTITKNNLYNNSIGIYFLSTAAKNNITHNIVQESLTYGIYTKINQSLSNYLGDNVLATNRKDISGEDIQE